MKRTGMKRMGMWGAAVAVGATLAGAPAQAQSWAAAMTGSQQVPANGSTASGFSRLSLDGDLLTVRVNWAGLAATPFGHIHCCVAPGNNTGVAVPFVGLPAGLTDSYVHTFNLLDASVYTSGFLAGASAQDGRDRLIAGLNAGLAYTNLHDAPNYPGGEIRGNLVTTPEPTSFALAAAAIGGVGIVARRRRAERA